MAFKEKQGDLSLNESSPQAIIIAMKTISERIFYIRKLLGLNQEGLAKRLGVTRGAVNNWEHGGNISRDNLLSLAREVPCSIDWLMDGKGDPPTRSGVIQFDEVKGVIDDEIDTGKMDRTDQRAVPDLPVYAAVEGGSGEMVVSSDPIDMVKRPWFLERAPTAYAVIVTGESMIPAFEPGDMALVNPRLPPIRGKDAIFVGIKGDGEFRAIIKRFISANETHFKAEQFNPPGPLALDRREWVAAYRVVGKYTGI